MAVNVATRRALNLDPDETEADLIAEICSESALPLSGLRRFADALSAGGKREQPAGAALYAFLETSNRTALVEYYLDVFLTKPNSSKPREARKSVANKSTLEAHPEFQDLIATETVRILALYQRREQILVADRTADLMILADRILSRYADTKRQTGLLDFDDLILATSDLFDREGIAPWVLYKLDGGIDHVLIDEAQDTNPEQWRVVNALTGEFFVGEGAREQVRTLFSVGDAKQSIFSFQKADATAFLTARDAVAEKAQALSFTAFENVTLNRSFRSTSAVLGVVDQVFATEDAARGLSRDPEPILHRAHRKGHAGLVELWPAEPAPVAEDREDWALPLEQGGGDAAEVRVAEKIAAKIAELVHGRDILKSKNRPIRASDIMILVRRRTGFVEAMVRALKAHKVRVAGADRMVVTEELPVMDLMALARFALLPEDDLTLATLLKSPLIGLDEESLFALAHNRGGMSLWESLRGATEDDPRFSSAVDLLSDLLAQADRVPPFDFFWHVLSVAGGRERLAAQLGHDIHDPVDEFLSLTLLYEQNHVPSLQGFLSWLLAGKTEVKRDMERGKDEVRILTVHAAKGLEAPIVFLPDTCQMPADRRKILAIPPAPPALASAVHVPVWPGRKAREFGPVADARAAHRAAQDAEYRRLMYVALTRAEDRLYVTGWETRNGRAKNCWYDLIAAGMEGVPEVKEFESEGGEIILRYETEQSASPDEPTEEDIIRPVDGVPPDWVRHPAPDEPTPPRPLAPSRPSDTDPAAASPLADASRPYRRGTIIHQLLELLPEIPESGRDTATAKFLSQPGLELDRDAQREIARTASDILNHSKFKPLFGTGSRAEASITGTLDGRVVSGQVDRLVVGETEVLVIDYKTNRPPPTEVNRVPIAYLRQMAAYRALLNKIYPHHRIRAALLWTETATLMELGEEELSAAAEEFVQV